MRIFMDESCTRSTQGPFMLIGGLVLDKDVAKAMRTAISALRSANALKPDFEFHFSHLDEKKLELYKKFVDIFFEHYDLKSTYKRGIAQSFTLRQACFEAMLIEHGKIDHARFNSGDTELGFFRFYHTVLANTVRKHYSGRDFHVIIDNIGTKDKDRVPALHRRLKDCCLPAAENPIKTVNRQDSKAEPLLQLADVLLGAVSRSWNCDPASASIATGRTGAKNALVQHVEMRLGKTLGSPTQPRASFNIWRLELAQHEKHTGAYTAIK